MRNLAENPPQEGRKKKKIKITFSGSTKYCGCHEGRTLLIVSAGKTERHIYMQCKENPCNSSFLLLGFFFLQGIRERVFSWAM